MALKMVGTSNFKAINIILITMFKKSLKLYSAQFVKEYWKELDKTASKIKRGKLIL